MMDSQHSATQAWCCVHQQLGCPSSSDPEDFDCSVLTDLTESKNEELKWGGNKHFLWRFKIQILGDYLRFDSFLGDVFFSKKSVHEQKELFHVFCAEWFLLKSQDTS